MLGDVKYCFVVIVDEEDDDDDDDDDVAGVTFTCRSSMSTQNRTPGCCPSALASAATFFTSPRPTATVRNPAALLSAAARRRFTPRTASESDSLASKLGSYTQPQQTVRVGGYAKRNVGAGHSRFLTTRMWRAVAFPDLSSKKHLSSLFTHVHSEHSSAGKTKLNDRAFPSLPPAQTRSAQTGWVVVPDEWRPCLCSRSFVHLYVCTHVRMCLHTVYVYVCMVCMCVGMYMCVSMY